MTLTQPPQYKSNLNRIEHLSLFVWDKSWPKEQFLKGREQWTIQNWGYRITLETNRLKDKQMDRCKTNRLWCACSASVLSFHALSLSFYMPGSLSKDRRFSVFLPPPPPLCFIMGLQNRFLKGVEHTGERQWTLLFSAKKHSAVCDWARQKQPTKRNIRSLSCSDIH